MNIAVLSRRQSMCSVTAEPDENHMARRSHHRVFFSAVCDSQMVVDKIGQRACHARTELVEDTELNRIERAEFEIVRHLARPLYDRR